MILSGHVIVEHPTLIDVQVSVPYTFLIKVLLLFQVFYSACLPLNCVLYLLILPQQCLLLLIKTADVLFHSYDLRVQFVHSLLEFLVAILLISEIIFHVFIHSVYVFFLVKELILL